MPSNPHDPAPPFAPLAKEPNLMAPLLPDIARVPEDDHLADGVEEQQRVLKNGNISVKARIEERQATEVPAMRYVLWGGIALAALAMFIAWLFLR